MYYRIYHYGFLKAMYAAMNSGQCHSVCWGCWELPVSRNDISFNFQTATVLLKVIRIEEMNYYI